MSHHEQSRTTRGRRRALVAVALAAALVASVPAATASASARSAGSSGAVAQSGGGVSPEVADQIAAVEDEKADRTPTEQKLDSNLLYATREDASEPAVEGAPELTSTIEPRADGTVLVDIDATVSPSLTKAIAAAGGDVVAAIPGFDAVRAQLPIDAVLDLAARSDVSGIRPADEATTNRSTGDATTSSVGAGASEADVTHAAATARTSYGVDGTGVKVCVLSDGVNTLAARQASGDLPAVDVLSGQAGSGDEGTAMLELIHDIAPGATLGFATAFTSQASFAQNIVNLQASGCEIIVDDVTYFAETTFQDANVAQAISTVRAAGVTYFSSAGNSGNLPDGTSGTWQGDFQDAGAAASPLPTTKRLHGWGTGAAYNTLTKATTVINLQWADPVGSSGNDYDLYLLNSAGSSIVASSTNLQTGSNNPSESISSGTAYAVGSRVVVTKTAAAASRYLVLYTNGGTLSVATSGSARGHNVSEAAVSVAATPAFTAIGGGHPTGPYPSTFSASSLSEKYSSDGPTRQYFTPAGAAITPGNFSSTGGVGRNGVDLTAADGVTTTTPGFIPFYGTSAAAPNAAALAALALAAKPSLTPTQLEAALAASAIDIETSGIDTVTGPGIAMAPALLATIGKAAIEAGARTVTPLTGDGDSIVEPGETASIAQVLTNSGGAPATSVTATLVSNSSDATVTQSTATYGTIAAGASGSPAGAPLAFSVAPGCPCGQALSFTLTVTFGGGASPSKAIPLDVIVGATPDVNAAYAGSPVAIPDNSAGGASATVSVSSTAAVQKLTVTIGGSACNINAGSTTVGLDHSYVGDLTLSLTSPQGTTVTLMSGTGAGGNNLCQTVFSDNAAASIQGQAASAAPFTGSFRPSSPLSAFNTQNPQGTWTLKAVDGAGSDTGSIRAFSIQIAGVDCTVPAGNTAPVAANDSYGTAQDQPLTVPAPGVLGNDTDVNSDALSAVLAAGPAHGSLTLNANGSFTYTPTAGYHGADSFTYKANDGTTSGNTATVSITVNGTPTGVADAYSTAFDTAKTVAAPGVLGNDTDPESNPLTAVLGTGPAHGTLTLNPNGSFTYTPTTGYSGPDSFTYRASDGTTQSAPTTVSLTVDPPGNQAPVGVGDSLTAIAGKAITKAAPGVLANDTDADGNPLTAVLVTSPSHGTLTLNADGSYTYSATSGYAGADSFTYQASDGTASSASTTVAITVISPNAAYVTAIYDDFLSRLGDASGTAYWAGRLDRGVETRTSFVLKMSRSHEYSVKIVTRAYNDVLGRNPDPSGREYWANKVQKGMPIATLVLNLIASNEYLTHTGGTVAGFVNSTFQAILARQPTSAERTTRVNQINGGKSRLSVASELYATTESRQRRTRTQFQLLLGRNPTSTELSAWVANLATKSDADLAVFLGASNEYYASTQNL